MPNSHVDMRLWPRNSLSRRFTTTNTSWVMSSTSALGPPSRAAQRATVAACSVYTASNVGVAGAPAGSLASAALRAAMGEVGTQVSDP